jgi:uncharacterized protein (TIGR02231 family)
MHFPKFPHPTPNNPISFLKIFKTMKSSLSLLTLFIVGINLLFAQTKIASKISEATVYRSGAKLSSTASVKLNPGQNQVIFEKLPVYLNPSSMQVRMDGKANLLSAAYRQNAIEIQSGSSASIQALQDSIEGIKDQVASLLAEKEVLTKEEASLAQNQSRVGTGENSALSINELKELTQYYRTRLSEIKNRQLELDILRRKAERIHQKMEQRLVKITQKETQVSGEIILQIESATAQTINIACIYFLPGASWVPSYDLRSEGVDKPLRLVHKAAIQQQSGLDWSNVKLKLSTAQPMRNNNRPILNPQYVNYYIYAVRQGPRDQEKDLKPSNMLQLKEVPAAVTDGIAREEISTGEEIFSEAQSGEEFELPQAQTLLSGAEALTLRYKEDQMEAIYQYHAIPKLDPGVFLLAKIPNYGRYGLLSGTAQIFLNDTYVGQSEIDIRTVADTLSLSLGRDEDISIKRIKPTDISYAPKFLNNYKKELIAYDIIIKNNKRIPVNIEILDQIPVSRQEDITVELIDKAGAQYTPDFGKLYWRIEVPAFSSKTLRFKYELKYPKDRQVTH